MARPQCLKVCVLYSSDCLAVNDDESQSQIPRSGENVIIPARVRCPPICSAVAEATKLYNTNVAPWEPQSGQTHPEVSASLVSEKGNAGELLCVNQIVGGPPLAFSAERTESRSVLHSKAQPSPKSLGLCAMHC